MMQLQDKRKAIQAGESYLGIELGSTRIKAVLTAGDGTTLASGSHSWENRLENGVWTYTLEDVWTGLQDAYSGMAADVKAQYDLTLTTVGAMGFSAMMHGYMAFDREGKLLAPFRTWRNTMTQQASEELTELLQFNIPQRWSIAHLYQAVLNGEEHVGRIAFLTTLAGYVHWQLTEEKVLGVGEASGMFPIDSEINDYDRTMVERFNEKAADMPWTLLDILPRVLNAGDKAGVLTEKGARLLDPSGLLQAGIPLCPPEGDAGTGMVATNSVGVRTGNVSAGTSVFAMIVLEKPLSRVYPEIDMVTTPTGRPVAMVHCNNCTNEINAWAKVFQGLLEALGQKPDMDAVYTAMFRAALNGAADGDGMVLFNYLSGEPITRLEAGRPLLVRAPESHLDFPNFMRVQLYSALATLKIGLDILAEEKVMMDRLLGHGGFFKTPEAGQRIMAAAADAPVSVMETAGEGGAWGIALLAAYMATRAADEPLENWLNDRIFADQKVETVWPKEEDVRGFGRFMESYRSALAVERTAVGSMQ